MAHHDFVRLKSSELIVALPAVEALSAWIAGSRSASTKLKHLGHADELLGLMHTCMLNFPDHQVVQNLLINVLLTFVQANKDLVRAVFKAGMLPILFNSLDLFLNVEHFENRVNLVQSIVKIVLILCTVDKRASLVVRLQGGLPRIVAILQNYDCISSPKLLRTAFELLDTLIKSSLSAPDTKANGGQLSARGTSSNNATAALLRMRAVPLLCALVRSLVPSSRLFAPGCAVLERLSGHEKGCEALMQEQIIPWSLSIMYARRVSSKGSSILIRLLRNIAKLPAGAAAITAAGGLDALLPIMHRDLTRPSFLKAASSLLWFLQKHHFKEIPPLISSMYSIHSFHTYHEPSTPPPLKFSQFIPTVVWNAAKLFAGPSAYFQMSNSTALPAAAAAAPVPLIRSSSTSNLKPETVSDATANQNAPSAFVSVFASIVKPNAETSTAASSTPSAATSTSSVPSNSTSAAPQPPAKLTHAASTSALFSAPSPKVSPTPSPPNVPAESDSFNLFLFCPELWPEHPNAQQCVKKLAQTSEQMCLPVTLLRKALAAKAAEAANESAAGSANPIASAVASSSSSTTATPSVSTQSNSSTSTSTAVSTSSNVASTPAPSMSLFAKPAPVEHNLQSLPPMLCLGGRPGIDAPPSGPDSMQMPPPGLILLMLLGLTQRMNNPNRFLKKVYDRDDLEPMFKLDPPPPPAPSPTAAASSSMFAAPSLRPISAQKSSFAASTAAAATAAMSRLNRPQSRSSTRLGSDQTDSMLSEALAATSIESQERPLAIPKRLAAQTSAPIAMPWLQQSSIAASPDALAELESTLSAAAAAGPISDEDDDEEDDDDEDDDENEEQGLMESESESSESDTEAAPVESGPTVVEDTAAVAASAASSSTDPAVLIDNMIAAAIAYADSRDEESVAAALLPEKHPMFDVDARYDFETSRCADVISRKPRRSAFAAAMEKNSNVLSAASEKASSSGTAEASKAGSLTRAKTMLTGSFNQSPTVVAAPSAASPSNVGTSGKTEESKGKASTKTVKKSSTKSKSKKKGDDDHDDDVVVVGRAMAAPRRVQSQRPPRTPESSSSSLPSIPRYHSASPNPNSSSLSSQLMQPPASISDINNISGDVTMSLLSLSAASVAASSSPTSSTSPISHSATSQLMTAAAAMDPAYMVNVADSEAPSASPLPGSKSPSVSTMMASSSRPSLTWANASRGQLMSPQSRATSATRRMLPSARAPSRLDVSDEASAAVAAPTPVVAATDKSSDETPTSAMNRRRGSFSERPASALRAPSPLQFTSSSLGAALSQLANFNLLSQSSSPSGRAMAAATSAAPTIVPAIVPASLTPTSRNDALISAGLSIVNQSSNGPVLMSSSAASILQSYNSASAATTPTQAQIPSSPTPSATSYFGASAQILSPMAAAVARTRRMGPPFILTPALGTTNSTVNAVAVPSIVTSAVSVISSGTMSPSMSIAAASVASVASPNSVSRRPPSASSFTNSIAAQSVPSLAASSSMPLLPSFMYAPTAQSSNRPSNRAVVDPQTQVLSSALPAPVAAPLASTPVSDLSRRRVTGGIMSSGAELPPPRRARVTPVAQPVIIVPSMPEPAIRTEFDHESNEDSTEDHSDDSQSDDSDESDSAYQSSEFDDLSADEADVTPVIAPQAVVLAPVVPLAPSVMFADVNASVVTSVAVESARAHALARPNSAMNSRTAAPIRSELPTVKVAVPSKIDVEPAVSHAAPSAGLVSPVAAPVPIVSPKSVVASMTSPTASTSNVSAASVTAAVSPAAPAAPVEENAPKMLRSKTTGSLRRAAVNAAPTLLTSTPSFYPAPYALPPAPLPAQGSIAAAMMKDALSQSRSDVPPLEFESRFESGNLHRAIQVGPSDYDLILSADVNSVGHTQWFCFRMRKMLHGHKYRLHIINFEKSASAFNMGMRPVLYSAKQESLTGHGWSRVGDDICYYRNFFKRPARRPVDVKPSAITAAPVPIEDQYFYSLSFSVTFPHDHDTVFLSYCYPFTYTFQRQCLAWMMRQPLLNICMRRQPLCYTRSGHACELLTITEFGASPEIMRARPVVFLTARVHPGETVASWTLKGLMEFITSAAPEACALRRQLVFKIVPMLNPDGVINGNYRCSLTGCDLNRRWQQPDKQLHPTLYHVKRLVRALAAERQLLLYCDFHGHSNLKDVVLYGCDDADAKNKDKEVAVDSDSGGSEDDEAPPSGATAAASTSTANTPVPASAASVPALKSSSPPPEEERFAPPLPLNGDWSWISSRGRSRLFPALLARRAPQYFNFDRCTFHVRQSKAGASRVVMWKDLKLIHSFTLEASFCGASNGPMGGLHFTPNDFEEVGKQFCLGLFDLVSADQNAVFAALADVQRSLAGKRSLPATYPQNLNLPAFAAVNAAKENGAFQSHVVEKEKEPKKEKKFKKKASTKKKSKKKA